MPDLSVRNLQPELMDDPSLDQMEHQRALAGLRRIHWFTGIENRFWRLINQKITTEGCKSLSILDVGCGDATLLRRLFQRCKKTDCAVRVIGCDFSEQALSLAKTAAEKENIPLETTRCDVTKEIIPDQADIVICSLFLHHFTDEEIPGILRNLAAATGSTLLIEDLIRSSLGYALCKLGVHLLSRSPIVHFDGPQSVKAALTIQEMAELLEQANLWTAKISKHWPERFLVTLNR